MNSSSHLDPSNSKTIVETRKITKEEAEICASERIAHINTIQPYGFVLVVVNTGLKPLLFAEYPHNQIFS